MSNKRYTRKYGNKIGKVAGSLFPLTEVKDETKIDSIEYSKDFFRHRKNLSIQEMFHREKKDTILWLNTDGSNNVKIISDIGEKYNIHKLILEDALDIDIRPKIEFFEDHIFISLKMISFKTDINELETENVCLIFGNNYVISIQEGKEGDVFDPIRFRLSDSNSSVRRKSADFLAYDIIDIIIDNYFITLEKISEKLEDLDENLIDNPTPEVLRKLYHLKREVLFLRKAVWPLREIIAKLDRIESNLIQESTKPYIRDLYDHIIQIIDTEETFRDIISGMMDLYLSSVSNKMNEIMKMLSIISTIFIPLTFIAGVYGMNFENMPELKMEYGYHSILLIMAVIVLIMLFYFRRKRWIN